MIVRYSRFILAVAVAYTTALCVQALSTPAPEIKPKPFIQIKNLLDIRSEDRLPASFVQNWPTWVLDMEGQITKIPDDNGFVSPASLDELFQPVDLKRPEMRFALAVHVRAGSIRHIMPALDLCYEGGLHRNRGMCSVPRAYGWIEYSDGMIDEWQNFYLKAETKGQSDDEWTTMGRTLTGSALSDGVQRMVMGMAESAPDELGEGSHMIHILLDPTKQEVMELPKSGTTLRVTMDEDDFLDSEDASGTLEVFIQTTMAGSESQYLPDAYKPLFEDEQFRNPRYAKFKAKQQQRPSEN